VRARGERRLHRRDVEPVMRGVDDRERADAREQRGHAARLPRVNGRRAQDNPAAARQRARDACRHLRIGIRDDEHRASRRRLDEIARGDSSHGACAEHDEGQPGISAARWR